MREHADHHAVGVSIHREVMVAVALEDGCGGCEIVDGRQTDASKKIDVVIDACVELTCGPRLCTVVSHVVLVRGVLSIDGRAEKTLVGASMSPVPELPLVSVTRVQKQLLLADPYEAVIEAWLPELYRLAIASFLPLLIKGFTDLGLLRETVIAPFADANPAASSGPSPAP